MVSLTLPTIVNEHSRSPRIVGADVRRLLREGPRARDRQQSGSLLLELMVAIAILAGVFFPLSLSLLYEQQALRAGYYRALAIGMVDGEMETLVAGEWRAFKPGEQEYPVKTSTNMPPGRFKLTVGENAIRLEWLPAKPATGGRVWREAKVR